jgi:hypothetical protein
MNRGAPTWFEKVWSYSVEDIDFEEWILLLKIQINYKVWVWKEKSVEPHCVHIAKFFLIQFENVKNRKCVHTLAKDTCDTGFYNYKKAIMHNGPKVMKL